MEEMIALVEEHILPVEAAGAGFAAAIALASNFRGQEAIAKQALHLAGIQWTGKEESGGGGGGDLNLALSAEDLATALSACRNVLNTLREQSEGWQKRSIFERQWMLRDFKKHCGMPVEQLLEGLGQLEKALKDGNGELEAAVRLRLPLQNLVAYYGHLQELSRGYIRDPQQLKESLRQVAGWQDEAARLVKLLS